MGVKLFHADRKAHRQDMTKANSHFSQLHKYASKTGVAIKLHNKIQRKGTCKITHHVTWILNSDLNVMPSDRFSLCQRKLHIAWNYWQTSSENHCFPVWLDFATWTITFKENISEIRMYFSTPSNHTFANVGAISVVVKTSSNEKISISIMLAILACGRKFSQHYFKTQNNA